ncbi:Methyltransferase domain-containing protein [Pseudooceanicola antarcticus]|uniref:Class I SAM-dependent methyltransferase n=1 Tax=Pseudooceanicola antarcticus TaxID=1247613 RepID=A0A285IWE9_9RHOB|nr:class I SAM-dependent methyltransferase [Pseudooceanicola antarcticus]SNY52268.1 Methyltransferase domain-containing protein [Pseudooceanicola antarcticus]
MAEKYLDKIYGVSDAETQRALYDQWAESYDSELDDARYATPSRIARALKPLLKEAELAAPVLDFGCGTGLSGEALAAEGFTRIHGADVSTGMLEMARAKGCYETLTPLPFGNPDPGLVSRYRTVTAAGAISPGAAPASCLPAIFMALPSGGRLALSYNEKALEDEEYMNMLTRITESSEAVLEVSEDGPHIEGLGSVSRVMVIRRR